MKKVNKVRASFASFTLFILFTFSIRPPASFAATKGPKLHVPAKTSKSAEAALFKGLATSIHGVGIVTPDEKKFLSQTIEREKAGILRHTMKLIYDHAYDLYRRGDYQGSLDVLNRIVILDPGYEQARALHSALSWAGKGSAMPSRIEAPKSAQEMVREKFFEALAIYRDGRKVEAVGKFEEVLALDPKHRKVRFYIDRINREIAKDYFEQGKFAQTQGRLEDALDKFYTAVSLDPESYAFVARQITDIESEVRSKKIGRHLEEALKALSAGNWDAVRSSAGEIFRLDPSNVRAQELVNESLERQFVALMAKGDSLLAKEQFDKAVEEYQRAVKLRYKTAEANRKIEMVNGKRKEAEELAKKREEEEKVKKEADDRAKAASDKAAKEKSALSPAGTAGGEAQAAVATEEAKQSSESHYQQAMQFYQTGDLERALVELNLSLKYDPNNQNAYGAKRMIEAKMSR